MEFDKHPRAEEIAADLIPKYHPHLVGTNISYLFKVAPVPVAKKKKAVAQSLRPKKKVTLATCAKVSAKTQALAEKDFQFVITFDFNRWQELTEEQRVALVDHELCHAGVDDKGCYLIPHSVEEFREIIDRHGFWKTDVQDFAESVIDSDKKSLTGETANG